jgi:hypothetical protein
MPCACETPKPVEVIDETFGGLFVEVPLEVSSFCYCDRCGGQLDVAR